MLSQHWEMAVTVSTVENGEVPVAGSFQAELNGDLSSILCRGTFCAEWEDGWHLSPLPVLRLGVIY